MTDELEHNDEATRRPRRRIGLTVGLLAGLAALIYFGFIGRGVFGG